MGSCGPLDVSDEPVQGDYLEMGLFDQVECSEVVSSQLFNCNRVESAHPILDKNLPLDPTCLFSNGFHDSSVVACDSRVDGEAPRVGTDGIEDVKGEFVISALDKLPEVRYEDTGICLTGRDESDQICCTGSIDESYLENDGSKFEDIVGNLVQDLEMPTTSSSTVVQPSEGTEQTHHVDVDHDIDFLEGTVMGLRGVLDEREECLAGLLDNFLAHSPHLEESSRDIDGETLDVASECTIGVSASFQLPVKSSRSRQLVLGDQETDEFFEDIMGNLLPNVEAPMAPSSSIAPHSEHTQDKYLMDGAENAIGLIKETTKNLQGVVEAGISDSLMNRTPHTEKNSCDPAGGSVNIAENSLQVLCLSGDVDCGFSRQLAMEAQETDGVIGAPSCSGLVDSTRHSVVVGRDTVKNCSSTMVSSTRRITRQSKSNKMSESAKRTADQCRKTSKNTSLQGETIGISFQVARRKRSFFSRRERSSIWGSLGNVMEVVTEYDEIPKHDTELVQVKGQKTRKRRDNPGNKRSQKTRASGKSLTSKEYNQSGQLRLKLKMGGKEDKRSPHAVLPEVVNSQVCLSTISSKCATEPDFQISSEILKSDNIVMHKLDKNVCGNGQCTVLGVSDSQQGDKDLESTVTQENSIGNTSSGCPPISSEKETVLLDEAIDKLYPEAGTSPDSEVINSMQDAAVIPNAVLTSLEAVLGPIDAAVPDMELMRSKKGKKHGKVKGTTCLGAEDQLLSCINQDKTRKSTKKLKGKVRGGCNSIDSSSLATNGNTPSYDSNLKRQPNESPLLSEISKLEESLEVETSIPNYEFFGEDAGIKASESGTTKGTLKSSKCMDPTRSSKSNSEVSKRRSRALDSARSRRKSTCDQKKKEVQKTISKKKIKEKGYPGQIVGKKNNQVTDGDNNSLFRTKNHPESKEHAELSKMKVVEPIIHDVPEKSTGTDVVSEDAFNSSMISSGLDGQLFPTRKAWVLCDDCQKWRCISASLADYIEETNCRWTCTENEDKAFADCSIPQEKTNAEINAELELSDVSGEEDASGSHINSKKHEVNQSTAVQQAHWKPIVSNLFLHRSRKTQTIDEVMVCHCKPPRDGSLGCGDECLNRMLNIECVRGTCPCGDRCSNQQFQKRKYAKLEHFRCGKKGYGLQLLENVTGGKFLIEYVGEVLDLNAYEARQREYASRGQKHFYFMTLNGSEVIDACAKGNLGRFINHSCDPNCRTEKWMVNGEVCIGLFAIRDIKKGEEVTFDYNYVRVFGAAAKKCVCGSSECRGYIGGDPSNTEVIVQGDSDEEFPEPVMIHEDGYAEDFLDKINIITRTNDGVSVHRSEAMVKSQSANKQSEVTLQDDIVSRSDSAVRSSEVTGFLEDKTGRCFTAIKSLDTASQTEFIPAESLSAVQHLHDSLQVEDIMSKTLSSTKLVKASSPAVDTVNESLSGSIATSSKPISTTYEEKPSIIKASPQIKSSRSSSSVKKGKCRSHQVTASRPSVVGSKPKKMLEGALTNRLKGVEEKLNELLDVDGGISKRKDSTKGYLKLLFVTAASGDNVKGEAVQSTRDLSIILDALLKTRSRMVLLDIINKNGLQMLHNIMKQNRRNFNKIPIIRKLLKVLTFLAEKEILTSEHMNSGPPCAGVESFKESIFQLARHNDMKVNQIARSFRDRWFPRTARRGGYPNRDDMKFESQGGVNCNRFSASCKRWRDEGVGPTDAMCCTSQGTVAGNIQIGTLGHFTDRFAANGTKSRKRKSRWDQPAETMRDKQLHEFMEDRKMKQRFEFSPHPEVREVAQDQVDQASGKDELRDMLDDAPPGFSSPVNTFRSSADDMPSTTNNHSHHGISASEVNVGCHQERYHPDMPVSYGIPLVLAEQLGTAQSETMDSWSVAPGIPFHPFPPLPSYPRDQPPSAMAGNEHEELQQSCAFTSQIVRPPDVATTGARNEKITAQMRCSSGSLGRRFFKQQKPNNWKSRRPWSRKRMGENVRQNSSRSRARNVGLGNFENETGGFRCSEGVSGRGENVSSTFRQRPEHHYDH